MPAPIRFCFDFISPYAYLGWTQIHRIAAAAGREVEAVAVLFAGLLNAHGTKGPAEVPARRRYVIVDAARLAHAFGVPIDAPAKHPFNPLFALRLASLPELSAERRRSLIDAFFGAAWRERRDLGDATVVAEVGAEAGLTPAEIERGGSDDVKARVRAQTDAAIAAGAFGVPTTFADGQMFFGCDSLPHLERHLRGELPIATDLVARWEHLPAGSSRKV